MSDRDFEEGRLCELENLLGAFEALFGAKPDDERLRKFYDEMDSEHTEAIVNLSLMEDGEQEAER